MSEDDEAEDSELDVVRRSMQRFRFVVVESLNKVIEDLDEKCERLESENKDLDAANEVLEEKAERLRHDCVSREGQVEKLITELADIKKELTIVKRDRDALVQRADTAEKTLQNHGINLTTMEREAGPHGHHNRDSRAVLERELRNRGLDQEPGRYVWRNPGP